MIENQFDEFFSQRYELIEPADKHDLFHDKFEGDFYYVERRDFGNENFCFLVLIPISEAESDDPPVVVTSDTETAEICPYSEVGKYEDIETDFPMDELTQFRRLNEALEAIQNDEAPAKYHTNRERYS